MVYNLKDGVIIAQEKFGPAFAGAQLDPKVTQLPDLRHWADIAFLDWQQESRNTPGHDISNLHYIFSLHIVNKETIKIIEQAWNIPEGEFDDNCRAWSFPNRKTVRYDAFYFGIVRGEDSVTYRAVMASPNSVSAAFLLIQHKDVFGEKAVIKEISIFCNEYFDNKGESAPEINLLFKIRKAAG